MQRRTIIIGAVAAVSLAIVITIIVKLTKKDEHMDIEQLLMVMEISRHGDRGPPKLYYNLTQEPLVPFNTSDGLRPAGKMQHFNLGQRIREKYIVQKGFLDANYSQNNIWVQTSDHIRTYLSSVYQLMGMFPNDQPNLEDYEKYDINETYLSNIQRLGKNYPRDYSFKINRVSKNDDYTIFTMKYICPRYEMLQTMAKNQVQYQIILDHFADFQQSMQQLVNQSIDNPNELFAVCSFIIWAIRQQELTLKFTMQKEDINYCKAFLDTKLYTATYGLEEIWKIGSYNILNQLKNISQGLKSSSLFELNSIGNFFAETKTITPKMPTFIHYSGHLETVSMVLEGLGLHDVTKYGVGSALFIEFFRKGHETYVRFIKYDAASKTETILLHPGRVEEQIKVEDFYTALSHQLKQYNFNNVSVKCQELQFSAQETDYFSGQSVINDLTIKFNLNDKSSMKATEDF